MGCDAEVYKGKNLTFDVDQMLYVERNIRERISQCSNRHARANNKYMGVDYNAFKPNEYIIYLDANNLYKWAMMKCLPLFGFAWVSDLDIGVFSIADDNSEGYFLEVDFEYPITSHADYPMCVERKAPPGSKLLKLLLTLENKLN